MSAGKPPNKGTCSSTTCPDTRHIPVLLSEVLSFLGSSGENVSLIVDGTAGSGGHLSILSEIQPSPILLGVERDPDAVLKLQDRFRGKENVRIRLGNYTEIPGFIEEMKLPPADCVLFDLGLSSVQLNTPERGFSFRLEGPLDMRFDMSSGTTAAELLNKATRSEIADIIFKYGEERRSRRIAEAIVKARPIYTTTELAGIVRTCSHGNPIKTCSRVFQAFRIAVNRELENLDLLLDGLSGWVTSGGKVAFITFHSLEDRKVKQYFRDSDCFEANSPKWTAPNKAEIKLNPRARSAKLRMGIRV